MAMAAARFLIRTATASRNPVFRLMSARTQATSAAPAPVAGSAADMVFTFASPSEVSYDDISKKCAFFSIYRFFIIKQRMYDKLIFPP
jgi:hypothetical protein